MIEVYRFANGFQKEAESTYGWLRHYNLNPRIATEGGDTVIRLPEREVSCLRLMQKADPARFGNIPQE